MARLGLRVVAGRTDERQAVGELVRRRFARRDRSGPPRPGAPRARSRGSCRCRDRAEGARPRPSARSRARWTGEWTRRSSSFVGLARGHADAARREAVGREAATDGHEPARVLRDARTAPGAGGMRSSSRSPVVIGLASTGARRERAARRAGPGSRRRPGPCAGGPQASRAAVSAAGSETGARQAKFSQTQARAGPVAVAAFRRAPRAPARPEPAWASTRFSFRGSRRRRRGAPRNRRVRARPRARPRAAESVRKSRAQRRRGKAGAAFATTAAKADKDLVGAAPVGRRRR